MAKLEIDNRGLPPPEPMVRILSALMKLGADDELCALMDREPFPLYAELGRRGFTWEFAGEDGDHLLTVRRQAS